MNYNIDVLEFITPTPNTSLVNGIAATFLLPRAPLPAVPSSTLVGTSNSKWFLEMSFRFHNLPTNFKLFFALVIVYITLIVSIRLSICCDSAMRLGEPHNQQFGICWTSLLYSLCLSFSWSSFFSAFYNDLHFNYEPREL